ncbi:Atg10p [Penicillium maclennaniae]|uniref:Atg10p n=1 Tax=Penicillium maclennaniae TaxID=1343394 RepID=UPI00253FE2EA|nr:Atg10p [Penicillium maclennaniae]KAJ5670250.1 Atg10p [Penicillium maclennaniae]
MVNPTICIVSFVSGPGNCNPLILSEKGAWTKLLARPLATTLILPSSTSPQADPQHHDTRVRRKLHPATWVLIVRDSGGSWGNPRQNGTHLTITRCVEVQEATEGSEVEGQELDDQDPEALIRTDLGPRLQIDYDIVLSPTYQVPVLYFTLRWHHHQGTLGLETVYQYVVPEQYRKELKTVGVLGGISCGYHPQSGAPAFFVHPCNTADAMAQIADARSVTPGTYLIIWLGLVGHCVNLHVPRELVASDGPSPS